MLKIVAIIILGGSLLALLLDWGIRYRRRRSAIKEKAIKAPEEEEFIVDVEHSPLFRIESNPHLSPYVLAIDTETIHAIGEEDSTEFSSPILALSWALLNDEGEIVKEEYHLLNWGKATNEKAIAIHQITDNDRRRGEDPRAVYHLLLRDAGRSRYIVAHNLPFHLTLIQRELEQLNLPTDLLTEQRQICTMELAQRLKIRRSWTGQGLRISLAHLFSQLYFGTLRTKISFRQKHIRDLRLLCLVLQRLRPWNNRS